MAWDARSSVVATSLAAAGAALLLRFPPERYAFYPACPFHAVTGLLCPGCGMTRALAALLTGHFAQAAHWNALVWLLPALPLLASVQSRRLRVRVTAALLAVALGYSVVRNLA